ncbi:MAG: hypothetical protein AMXMBFR7_51000 [Planctomycetota bacterium]
MSAIKWTLQRIFDPVLTFRQLREWERSERKLFDEHYERVVKVRAQELKAFKARGRGSGKGKWFKSIARELYVLDSAYRALVLDLAESKRFKVWRTWMMLNCQPAFGRWTADEFGDGLAGKRCDSPICPWCYRRRFEMLLKLCRRDLRLGNRVNAIRFGIVSEDVETLGEDLAYLNKCARRFLRSRFSSIPALRVTTFTWFHFKNVGHRPIQILSYIYSSDCTPIDELPRIDRLKVAASRGEPVKSVLMRAWRFPVHAMCPEVSPDLVCSVLRHMHGRRLFGLVNKPKQKS